MSALEERDLSPAYRAAREGLAHRRRDSAVLDIEGPEREAFLQGQLTQDVRDLAPGETRPTAALTPKGKLLFIARLVEMPGRIRLLLPSASRQAALEHLRKFAAFQKVTVRDRSEELVEIALYGPGAARAGAPAEGLALAGSGEFSAQWLLPRSRLAEAEAHLRAAGSLELDPGSAEALRIEAGRPRFGSDIDATNLPDEAGLDAAVSATKGCYVGQEVVARRRVYGRANRRLVGYRFPDGPLSAGARLRRTAAPEEEPERTEAGRVTSSGHSPRFGPIGLGFAFHDVPAEGRLFGPGDPPRAAVVSALPFA
ncbi:MAG: YgfZ/GcvT domain-containing protein [Acidobacteriota bacterium]